jgi:transcription initiation factor TFIID subunit 5
VTDFLLKRGYNRTERVFREESRNINDEGRPIVDENAPWAPHKYQKAFDLLKGWVENNLSVYKVGSACPPSPCWGFLDSANQP